LLEFEFANLVAIEAAESAAFFIAVRVLIRDEVGNTVLHCGSFSTLLECP
jgi:hypothetical protein